MSDAVSVWSVVRSSVWKFWMLRPGVQEGRAPATSSWGRRFHSVRREDSECNEGTSGPWSPWRVLVVSSEYGRWNRACSSVERMTLRSRVRVGDGIGARCACEAALTATQDSAYDVMVSRTLPLMPRDSRVSTMVGIVRFASRPMVGGRVMRRMPSRLSSVSSPCWSRAVKSSKCMS